MGKCKGVYLCLPHDMSYIDVLVALYTNCH